MSELPKIAPEARADLETVGAALQGQLTELQNLALQAKQAHWNVSGTLYYPLHELLQEHYEGYSEYADRVAERMLSIGVSSDGRAETIVETANMTTIPGGFIDDAEVLRFFIGELKLVGDRTRQRIRDTEDLDPTSANLLQEVEYILGQYQWQYRAHAQMVHAALVYFAPVYAVLVPVAPVHIAADVVLAQAYVHHPNVPYSAKRVDPAVYTRIVLVAVGTVCYSAPPCLRYCLRNCFSLNPLW